MKHTDPVMRDVWRAKKAIAMKHESLAAYVAALREQSKYPHPGGRIPRSRGKDG